MMEPEIFVAILALSVALATWLLWKDDDSAGSPPPQPPTGSV